MASVWIALKGYVPYFWREWVTGVDHKRIGVMYMPLAMLMMPRGFIDAIIMRSQQAFVFREPSRAARETALSVLSTEMIVSTTPGTVEQRAQ